MVVLTDPARTTTDLTEAGRTPGKIFVPTQNPTVKKDGSVKADFKNPTDFIRVVDRVEADLKRSGLGDVADQLEERITKNDPQRTATINLGRGINQYIDDLKDGKIVPGPGGQVIESTRILEKVIEKPVLVPVADQVTKITGDIAAGLGSGLGDLKKYAVLGAVGLAGLLILTRK